MLTSALPSDGMSEKLHKLTLDSIFAVFIVT